MNDSVKKRRAIEALRAGIPSRDAVRELPPRQADVETAYTELLDGIETLIVEAKRPRGLLLKGDFGAGKSHWLESFRHRALERGFVVSTVSVGKEGPLFDLAKLYRACVESAMVQGVIGPALDGIVSRYCSNTKDSNGEFRYVPFHEWLDKSSGLDPRFEVTLRLCTAQGLDPEVQKAVVREWSGYPMLVPAFKKALKDTGMTKEIVGPYTKVGLDRAHFAFLNQLFWSAGRKGWVVLLDEGETMAQYNQLQRLKSYANLSWLQSGIGGGPGVVFAMTPVLAGQVLDEGKNDLVNMRAKFEGGKHESLLDETEKGIKLLMGSGTTIRSHDKDELRKVHDAVRTLYTSAYEDWPAPDAFRPEDFESNKAVRKYIRTWILRWDLKRLSPS